MRTWYLVTNVILTATEGDYELAVQVSTFFDNALFAAKANPAIQAMYDEYHPFHVALIDIYTEWKQKFGDKKGKTESLNHQLQILSNIKIKAWDIAIQNVYPNQTGKYKSLLPNKRGPFQTGKQISRIEACKALSLALTNDVALASVKTDVDNFIITLESSYNTQKQEISLVGTDSDLVETARVNMAIEQYGIIGYLIYLYRNDLDLVANFVDLNAIRNAIQTHYTGTIKPIAIHNVCKRTLHAENEVRLYNPGTTILKFYIAQHKDESAPQSAITVNPGEEITIFANQLGNLDYKHITVYNVSDTYDGEFIIDFE